jgi:GR25 family glycosyltransferase involved in LPS biosynthesis
MINPNLLDNISIRVINLEHRVDRKNESIEEGSKVGIILSSNDFFKAKHSPSDGAIGCALSHAKALADYLFNSEKPFVLILEDDFEIKDSLNFQATLLSLTTDSSKWDIFLLGHNQAIPIEPSPFANIYRVINAQTMSGYLVKRECVPRLIDCFFTSAELLRKYQNLPEPNRNFARHLSVCDVKWKEIQSKIVFYASIPALIHQRQSYSDVEKKDVNYGV